MPDKEWWEARVLPYLPDDTVTWESLADAERAEVAELRQRVEARQTSHKSTPSEE